MLRRFFFVESLLFDGVAGAFTLFGFAYARMFEARLKFTFLDVLLLSLFFGV